MQIIDQHQPKIPRKSLIFWFVLSLVFSVIYSLLALRYAFSSQYVVQDDAREYLIWMQRFLDPDLLKGDLIADYFQSVTPEGYATLYRLMATIGISPLILNKLLPTILGLIITAYCFGICLEILPIPMVGFIGSLLLNQSNWLKDDLLSAIPRAFIYPFLLAFIYYLLRRSWIMAGIATLLLGLFYPVTLLLVVGILLLQIGLNLWSSRQQKQAENAQDKTLSLTIKPQLSTAFTRKDYLFSILCLGICLLVLIPYSLSQSQFGPTITWAEARTLPEFAMGGKIPFFDDAHPWSFWLKGPHSGIRLSINPPLVGFAFLLPLLMRSSSIFTSTKKVTSNLMILPQIVLVSLASFFAAHAVLFKLFLPTRHTLHSLRIVLAIAAGIALCIILTTAFDALKNYRLYWQKFLVGITAISLAILLVFYPNLFYKNSFPDNSYVTGNAPDLYQFLLKQPKDSLIAYLGDEADNIPIFAQRRILASWEYSVPYHVGYYHQFRERSIDLINAQYNSNLTAAKSLIDKYGIDFWIVDLSAFTPQYLAGNKWLQEYQPTTSEAIAHLEQGMIPAIAKISDHCAVLKTEGMVVMPAKCVLDAQS